MRFANPVEYLINPAGAQKPRLEHAPRSPGINPDGTITLLHGTTALNAASIRQRGFLPASPVGVAIEIAALYNLRPRDIFNHVTFEFARHRTDRDRVHFTSIPTTAQAYTVPEVVQDALRAVWVLKYGTEHVSRESLQQLQTWVRREGEKLSAPEVLAVTMPWHVVGDHAFGLKLSLNEWLKFGKISDLHSISVPIKALQDVSIAPATHGV
jgi:hypothetical protein